MTKERKKNSLYVDLSCRYCCFFIILKKSWPSQTYSCEKQGIFQVLGSGISTCKPNVYYPILLQIEMLCFNLGWKHSTKDREKINNGRPRSKVQSYFYFLKRQALENL